MIQGENVGCGTSTTGTGTITLAAVPTGTGLVDPVTAFGTSGAWTVGYTILEYTDSTFTVPKNEEQGIGTLTLASGLTSVTLSRDTVKVTNVPATPAYTNVSPTAVSIGTAANTLVYFNTAGAWNTPAPLPYFATSGITGMDSLGFAPVQVASGTATVVIGPGTSNGTLIYQRVQIPYSGIIRSASVRVASAMTTAASSTIAMGLYQINSSGLPGKRLINFGTSATGALNAVGNVTCQAAAGVFIQAGYYIQAILAIGGASSSGNAGFAACNSVAASPWGTALATGSGPLFILTVASQTALTDPATTTAIAAYTSGIYEFSLAYRPT